MVQEEYNAQGEYNRFSAWKFKRIQASFRRNVCPVNLILVFQSTSSLPLLLKCWTSEMNYLLVRGESMAAEF